MPPSVAVNRTVPAAVFPVVGRTTAIAAVTSGAAGATACANAVDGAAGPCMYATEKTPATTNGPANFIHRFMAISFNLLNIQASRSYPAHRRAILLAPYWLTQGRKTPICQTF